MTVRQRAKRKPLMLHYHEYLCREHGFTKRMCGACVGRITAMKWSKPK